MSAIVLSSSGEFTVVKLVPTKKQHLKQLQGLVGGNIELLPHGKAWDAPWTGYANDEGVLESLPSNPVAWSVLQKLGFLDSTLYPRAYAGDVVLLAAKERGLTETQVAQVKAIYDSVCAE